MTSKAAKKAYREATKLPKISKAEQRRIEAAEIARQKKEYEKEKAAAKAKAAREKKLKKEAEERVKRKELGLPEPSRFVRPSQPTIKTFVKSGAVGKRSWQEVDGKEEDLADTGIEGDNECQPKQQAENPAKRITLEREDEGDEFGDFPSLSQADLPTLFAEPDGMSRTASSELSPSRSPCAQPKSQLVQYEATDHVPMVDQAKLGVEMAESQLLTKVLLATAAPSVHQSQSPTTSQNISSRLRGRRTETSAVSPSNVPRPHVLKTTTPTTQTNVPSKLVDERSRLMPPPAVPMTVNRLGSRMPLSEVSRNMAPPSRLSNAEAVTSASKVGPKSERRMGRENLSVPPTSTLAFLEVHLDDFFPSPSQQVRELLEDVDDMPSNTQIAREIYVEHSENAARPLCVPKSLPETQPRIEDEALHFFSSQDLEISSQDLRDIDTPSKPVQKPLLPSDVMDPHPVETEPTPAPPTPRLKPRFFEEKEDDLLYAALHESLLLAKQTTQCSSSRRSQRILRRTQSAKTDHGGDDYGSDGLDLDADLLALLDDA
jgi:hypothetical protein